MLIILSIASLVLSWLLPLHFPPWVSWHLEVLAFSSVFLLAWAVIFKPKFSGQARTVSIPMLTLPFMALGMLVLGQYATGLLTFGGDALVLGLYMALCILCLIMGFAFGESMPGDLSTDHAQRIDAVLRLTAIVMLAGAFASAVIAFVQVLDVWNTAWINRMQELRRPGGNLAQPNHLGTLLIMGLASLLFLYESGKLKALSSIAIFLVLAAALAVTESRTGVLSLLLLGGWWLVKSRRANFKLPVWAVLTGIAGFLVFFWSWPSLFTHIHQLDGGGRVIGNPGSRLVVWPQLLDAMMQRPWFGWGLGNMVEAHNSVVHRYGSSESFSYSHNILLDLGLGLGAPLAIVLIALTGVWLWTRGRHANHLFAWYCLAMALPLAMHSMLEFPFAYAYFLVPVMFVLGVLESMAGGKVAFRVRLNLAVPILLMVNGVAVWSAIEYFKIEEDFRIVRFEALRTGKTPAEYKKPEVIMLTQLGALLDGARLTPRPGMTNEELELARKVAMRYPWTAPQNRYAMSLALNGNKEEAIRQLLVIRAQHGEQPYEELKAHWNSLANEKFPELHKIVMP